MNMASMHWFMWAATKGGCVWKLVFAQEIVNNSWTSMDSGPAPRVLDRQGTAQWPEPTAPGREYLVTDIRISRIQLIRLTEKTFLMNSHEDLAV